MENKFRVSTPIDISLYNYIKGLGNELYNLNPTYIAQNAYDYCNELTKEELDKKLADTVKVYYKLLISRTATKLIRVKTKESMQNYYAKNLIMLYILVFLQDHENVFGITEENRFSV